MKIIFRGIMVALACLVFMLSAEAAKTPAPAPTPSPMAPPIPAPLQALHDQLAATLSPAARTWAADEAAKTAKSTKMTDGNIRADIQTRFTGQSLGETDKNILLFIVMTEAAKTMGDDLMEKGNEILKKAQKQNPPPAPGGSTTVNVPTEEWIPLQAAVQRRASFMDAMTAVSKKISGAQGDVLGRLQ